MGLSRREVIFLQLLTMDMPGSELLRVAPKIITTTLRLTGHGGIHPREVVSHVLDLYEARAVVILRTYALNTGNDPDCVFGVRATLFREHILTHVRMDTTKVNKWDFYQCILDLPWFENFLVISPE